MGLLTNGDFELGSDFWMVGVDSNSELLLLQLIVKETLISLQMLQLLEILGM